MMRNVLQIVWRITRLFLIVPFACAVIFIAWLLSTKEGTQFIAMEASSRLAALQLKGVDGYLLGDLTVEFLQWREESVIVSAQDVSVNWAPFCLLEKNICLDQLSAEQLIIELNPSIDKEEAPSDGELPSIVMPVGIFADWADIKVLQLSLAGQIHTIADLQFSGRWVDSLLALPQIAANYQGVGLSGSGEMDFKTPWVSQFRGSVSYDLPDTVSKQPLNFDFELSGVQLAFDIKGDLTGEWPATLSSTISFDDPRLPLSLKFESPTLWQVPSGGEQGEKKTTPLDIKQFTADIGLRDLTFEARSKLITPFWSELSVSLDGQWQQDRLKLKQLQLDSKDGQVRLQGELINTAQMPFEVTVSTRQLALHKATLPGSKPLLPYPVIFDSQWSVSGVVGEGNPDIQFNLKRLKGNVNQYPIDVQALFNYDSVMWRVNEMVVSSGDNQLSASGALNAAGDRFQQIEMHFSLPEPQQWLPGLSGSLEGGISIDGSIDKLDLHGQLTTEMLTYGDLSVSSVETVFDIVQSGKAESTLTLSAENLSIGSTFIESTDWQLKGDRDGSAVQGNVVLKDRGTAALNCDVVWDVTIDEANNVAPPLKGHIESECGKLSWQSDVFPYAMFTPHNAQPITINWTIDDSSLVIKPFCLTDEEIELCNHQDALWDPINGYSLGLSAKKLPVKQLLDRWNSLVEEDERLENLELQGYLNGQAKISQKPGSTIDAAMAFDIPEFDLWLGRKRTTSYDSGSKHHLKDDGVAPFHLAFEPITMASVMRDENITVDAHFSSPQLGQAISQLTITDIAKQRLIAGELSLSKLDLSFLENILPSVERISGLLSSQVNVSGSLKQPALSGRFNLADGALKSDYLPETLDKIAIDGVFDQYQLSYQGIFSSTGGQANLNGNLNWQDDWLLSTSLRSEAFNITPRSGVNLTIKPNLTLLLSEGFADISGTFEIPHARIKLDALPEGTKSVSSDARVIGAEQASSEVEWRYQTNIELILGDDVYFRGFGVNTYLTGQLLLRQKPGQVLGGKGEINTDDGFYTIFGQRLTVKEGRFIFNGPLERPDLQLDAMRAISGSSVKVGVKVTGPANEPEVTFYSQPAMNETSVIHYLLTGRAPDSNANNADLLNNMMLSAGIFGSSELTEKWANKIGVTDLQISTQSDDEGTSLEVSGYISPDIYLKYGASLYDEAKTVAMRYRLRPNLFIEAAGGFNSSLDIIYSFEHR